MTPKIVRLTKEHLPAVAELERQCFPEPWSEHALELFLGENAVAMVAVDGGTVLGYGSMLFVPGEGQLVNLAVLSTARRQGIGKQILSSLIEEAKNRGAETISLEVRVSNAAAIALYEGFGFRSVGIRKRFYRQPVEDAAVMICDLSRKSPEI